MAVSAAASTQKTAAQSFTTALLQLMLTADCLLQTVETEIQMRLFLMQNYSLNQLCNLHEIEATLVPYFKMRSTNYNTKVVTNTSNTSFLNESTPEQREAYVKKLQGCTRIAEENGDNRAASLYVQAVTLFKVVGTVKSGAPPPPGPSPVPPVPPPSDGPTVQVVAVPASVPLQTAEYAVTAASGKNRNVVPPDASWLERARLLSLELMDSAPEASSFYGRALSFHCGYPDLQQCARTESQADVALQQKYPELYALIERAQRLCGSSERPSAVFLV